MAKKGDARTIVRLKSTQSEHSYYTQKNRRATPGRLERRKYDPVLRKHVLYREEK